jgi:UDP-N-acetylmuramoylalanine--D-glutamate ligase
MAKALWNFKTQAGRLTIIKKQGSLTYVNDTASTRPEATTAAVTAFANTAIHLIIGGSRKHPQAQQYEDMFNNIKSANVQTIALIGSLASWLAKRAARVGLPKDCVLAQSGTLAKAVSLCQRRAAAARKKTSQVILLSPGCESFGEFVDYRQRGEKFRELVIR